MTKQSKTGTARRNRGRGKPVGPGGGRRSPGRVNWVLAGGIIAIALALTVLWWATRIPATDQDRAETLPDRSLSNLALARMPAEFESQEALLLGGTQLVGLFPGLLVEIVAAVQGRLPVVVLVNTPAEEQLVRQLLTQRQVPAVAWRTLRLPIRTMWVRDFAPHLVEDPRGGRQLIGFHYRERRGNQVDNTLPASLAEMLDLPLREAPLLLEGGDFLSNGRGVCLSSDRLIKRNIYYKELNDREMGEMLSSNLGFTDWPAFPQLEGEPTGHVDMFLTLVAPDVAVVGRYDADADSTNALLLDRTARELAAVPSGAGGNFQVKRIPMPPHADVVWRTYTNVVYANGGLLVPTFPDYCPELDTQALETYRGLLPGWEVVGLDVSGLIRMNGALRCLTMNMPLVSGAPLDFP